jgi:hypothetical protein
MSATISTPPTYATKDYIPKHSVYTVAAALAVFCILLGLTGLTGWHYRIKGGLSIEAVNASLMPPATALLFVFQGIAALTYAFRNTPRMMGLMVIATLCSLLTVAVAFIHPSPVLPVVVIESIPNATARAQEIIIDSGRLKLGLPAWGTVLAIAMFAMADLLALRHAPMPRVVLVSTAASLIGFIGVVGHIIDLPAFFFYTGSQAMSPQSAVGILALAGAKALPLWAFCRETRKKNESSR